MGPLLLVILGAVGFGFFLIFLLALSDKKAKLKEPPGHPSLSPSSFEKACILIIEGMKLEIDEMNRVGETQVDVLARNPTPITGGTYLVHCLHVEPGAVITAPQILELSNMVVQERLSKGIFITNGHFTAEVPGIGELAPMEYIDKEAFDQLLKKFAPDYLVIRS